MSNQGEYPEDNRVGKHEPHDLSLTRRDLIKVSAATAATAVVYPHSTLAASVPAATPAPEIMPLTLKVNGKTEQLEVDTRTTLLDALRENLHLIGTKKVAITDGAEPVPCWSMVAGLMPALTLFSHASGAGSPPLKAQVRQIIFTPCRRPLSSMMASSAATAPPGKFAHQ